MVYCKIQKYFTMRHALAFCFCVPFVLSSPIHAGFTADGSVYPQDESQWQSDQDATVGYEAAGSVLINGGSNISIDAVHVGNANGPTAQALFTVTGTGTTLNAYSIDVGYNSNGVGTLSVADGANVTTVSNMSAGYHGGIGSITFQDANTSVQIGGSFNIGEQGSGTVSVNDSAYVSVGGNLTVGHDGGTADLTVDGAGTKIEVKVSSTLPVEDVSEDEHMINVGDAGVGTLSITNGAYVSSAYRTRVGYQNNGNGTISVSGAGSVLNVGNSLNIGDTGTAIGTVNLSNQGSIITGGNISLGYNSGTGNMTIDGGGTTTQIGGSFNIGDGGNGGTCTISSQAHVSVAHNVVVALQSSTSKLDITGVSDLSMLESVNPNDGISDYSNTALVVNGDFRMGDDSPMSALAEVNISSRAHLSVGGDLTVALNDGRAALEIRGVEDAENLNDGDNNTAVYVGGSLNIGESAGGYVGVYDQAYVSVGGNLTVGHHTGSDHTSSMTIDGAGTKVEVKSSSIDDAVGEDSHMINVGDAAEGTLDITNGAYVYSEYRTRVGYNAGGVGVMNVSGSNTTLQVDNSLNVGDTHGNGTVTISERATVNIKENLSIGYISASTSGEHSTGAVTIKGNGTSVIVSGNLNVAHTAEMDPFDQKSTSHGVLYVEDGGYLHVVGNAELGHYYFGSDSNDIGAAYVRGESSILQVDMIFYVGGVYESFPQHYGGIGSLHISDGGLVMVGKELRINDHESYVYMETGGQLAIKTDDPNIDTLAELYEGFIHLPEYMRYYNGTAWVELSTDTPLSEYSVAYWSDGVLANYTVLTVGTSVPEPATWGLLAGLAAFILLARKKYANRHSVNH